MDKCLPARERSSAVDTSELSGQSIAFFATGRCVLATVTALQLIINLAGKFEFQFTRTNRQFGCEPNHRYLIALVQFDIN